MNDIKEIEEKKENDLLKKEKHPAGNGSAHKIPMIAFGDDYRKWDDKHKISYLEKLASSMNHAADVMQTERNLAMNSLKQVQEFLVSAGAELEAQKNLLITQITTDNAEKQETALIIQDLQKENRRMSKLLDNLQS